MLANRVAVMSGDRLCRICLNPLLPRRYRTLYHEDIIPLHRHIHLIVGHIHEDDANGNGLLNFLCNLCFSKLRQLDVAYNKMRQIHAFIESNLDTLTAIHVSARQKLLAVKASKNTPV